MSKHTPGPWKVCQEPEYPSLVSVEMSNGKEVGYFAARSEPEEMANAALIAAAPDLYAALSQSRGQWIHSVNAKACLEALAKAEGK